MRFAYGESLRDSFYYVVSLPLFLANHRYESGSTLQQTLQRAESIYG